MEVYLDLHHLRILPFLIRLLPTIHRSAMGHLYRRHHFCHFWNAYPDVTAILHSLADGYWFVKLLLFIFFEGLGAFSFLTVFNTDRR